MNLLLSGEDKKYGYTMKASQKDNPPLPSGNTSLLAQHVSLYDSNTKYVFKMPANKR